MKKIICSHGFGVAADSRGMFTEIAAGLPEYEVITFDYNQILPNGDMLVAPLDEQAKTLQRIIDQQEDGSILLCHSQGCVVAGLVDLSKVSKVILLAPPVNLSIQRVIDKMLKRLGSEINLEGMSKLPRSDGTTTLLSQEYIRNLYDKNPMDLYQKIANSKPTIIIRATEDHVLGLTNINEIQNATHIDIASDHNFTDNGRNELIKQLKEVL